MLQQYGKRVKLKFRKFLWLISMFADVTEEKLVGIAFLLPPILNRIKISEDPPCLGVHI